MKNTTLVIGQRYYQRVRPLFLPYHFLGGATDHHILPKIFNQVVLFKVAIFDLKLYNK